MDTFRAASSVHKADPGKRLLHQGARSNSVSTTLITSTVPSRKMRSGIPQLEWWYGISDAAMMLFTRALVRQLSRADVNRYRRAGCPTAERCDEGLKRILEHAIGPVGAALGHRGVPGGQHDVDSNDAHILLASRDAVEDGFRLGEPRQVKA